MTPLVPIMLFGWVPFTIYLFHRLPPHRAVLVSVIGGWLLLPTTGYDLPGVPPYDKSTAIALGLVLGGRLSGQRHIADFRWRIHDLPIVLWCLSPIPTSIANQLGLYEGLSGVYSQIMVWGIPYLAGRIYFKNGQHLLDLCRGIIVGAMGYAILCLYEIRMSPRLNVAFYGFFPHEWRQHYRYGGWRPIVFMQHGLMVALWMASSATAAFWLWRCRTVPHLKGIPMGFVVALLVTTAVLCKTASGWVALALGWGGYFVYQRFKGNLFLTLLLLIVPFYIGLRITNVIAVGDVVDVAATIFDTARTESLGIRLVQEELFVQRAIEQPLFGWGGYSRGWPVDPGTGKKMIKMVDALWVIVLSSKGFFGLGSLFLAMLIGPWQVLRTARQRANKDAPAVVVPVVLGLIVVLFMVDSLVNAMVNPVYILCAGALCAWGLAGRRTEQD